MDVSEYFETLFNNNSTALTLNYTNILTFCKYPQICEFSNTQSKNYMCTECKNNPAHIDILDRRFWCEIVSDKNKCFFCCLSKAYVRLDSIIDHLCYMLVHCHKLKSLVLSGGLVNATQVGQICLAITSDSRLEYLNLKALNLSCGDCGTISIGQMLKTNTSLKKLNLSCNRLTSSDLASITQNLKYNSCLLSLNISKNYIDYGGCILMADALISNTSLTSCHMGTNYITKRFGDNDDSPIAYNDNGLRELCNALIKNNTLEILKLGFCGIDNMGSKWIGKCLKNNTSLRLLDVSSNNIDDNGCMYISNGIKMNNTLKRLKLSNNKITNIIDIADAIKSNNRCNIDVLDIGKNNINSSMQYISDMLMTNTSITSLNLQKVSMDVHGLRWLYRSLKTNKIIIDLNLSNNDLDADALPLIRKILLRNNLTSLNVVDNHFEMDDVILDCLKSNYTLLHLNYNGIDIGGIEKINSCTNRNYINRKYKTCLLLEMLCTDEW